MVEVVEVALVVEVESVDALASSDEGGGGGGGPCGPSVPGAPEFATVLDVPSVPDVASVLFRSLARVVRRLCNCFRSATSVLDDDEVSLDAVLPSVAVVVVLDDELPSSVSEASRPVASLDEVVPEALGGGPGGGPLTSCGPPEPSLLELEPSLPSELLLVCSCDNTDIRFDTAELSPLASTDDIAAVELDAVEDDVEVEVVVLVAAAVLAEVEVFWLCARWW